MDNHGWLWCWLKMNTQTTTYTECPNVLEKVNIMKALLCQGRRAAAATTAGCQLSCPAAAILLVARHRPFSSSSSEDADPPIMGRNLEDAPRNAPEAESLREVLEELRKQGMTDFEPRPVSDGDHLEPWKKLLGIPARAAWRVSAVDPPLADTVQHVMEIPANRFTRKQLKQTFRLILDRQQALQGRRDRERQRWINRREYLEPERNTDSGLLPVVYGPLESLAHLYFRAEAMYAVNRRVLQEARSLLGQDTFRPQRVLDFGIGCGTASVAALHTWGDSIEWVHGIDCSQSMQKMAQVVMEQVRQEQEQEEKEKEQPKEPAAEVNVLEQVIREQFQPEPDPESPPKPPVRITYAAHLSASPGDDDEDNDNNNNNNNNDNNDESDTAQSNAKPFDLALLSYTAMEFTHNGGTLAAAATVFDKLRPGGVLVVIEPGTPDGFNTIRTIRNMLLDTCPPHANHELKRDGDDECHVIAPCTHNGRCPMEQLHYHRHKESLPTPTQMDMEAYELYRNRRKQFYGTGGSSSSKSSTKKKSNTDDSDDEDDDEESYDDDEGIMSKGYCSFVQTMSSVTKTYKGEKFSYLVVQKRIAGQPPPTPSGRFDDVNIPDLLQRVGSAAYQVPDEWHESPETLLERAVELQDEYLDGQGDALGLDFIQSHRSSFGRIIHAPAKKRGHVLIDTCVGTPYGKIVRTKVNKALTKAIPGIFAAARKSRWGGFWPIIEELQEDHVFRRKRKNNNKSTTKK